MKHKAESSLLLLVIKYLYIIDGVSTPYETSIAVVRSSVAITVVFFVVLRIVYFLLAPLSTLMSYVFLAKIEITHPRRLPFLQQSKNARC